MKTGGEDGLSALGVGACFGPPVAETVKGGSSAVGVCVISQPANENI